MRALRPLPGPALTAQSMASPVLPTPPTTVSVSVPASGCIYPSRWRPRSAVPLSPRGSSPEPSIRWGPEVQWVPPTVTPPVGPPAATLSRQARGCPLWAAHRALKEDRSPAPAWPPGRRAAGHQEAPVPFHLCHPGGPFPTWPHLISFWGAL